jgi:hypothetical protein
MLAPDVTKGRPARQPLVWNKKPWQATCPGYRPKKGASNLDTPRSLAATAGDCPEIKTPFTAPVTHRHQPWALCCVCLLVICRVGGRIKRRRHTSSNKPATGGTVESWHPMSDERQEQDRHRSQPECSAWMLGKPSQVEPKPSPPVRGQQGLWAAFGRNADRRRA